MYGAHIERAEHLFRGETLHRSQFLTALLEPKLNYQAWREKVVDLGVAIEEEKIMDNIHPSALYELLMNQVRRDGDNSRVFPESTNNTDRDDVISVLLVAGYELGSPMAVDIYSEEVAGAVANLVETYFDNNDNWACNTLMLGVRLRSLIEGELQPVPFPKVKPLDLDILRN